MAMFKYNKYDTLIELSLRTLASESDKRCLSARRNHHLDLQMISPSSLKLTAFNRIMKLRQQASTMHLERERDTWYVRVILTVCTCLFDCRPYEVNHL
jgi:hypothetical protein